MAFVKKRFGQITNLLYQPGWLPSPVIQYPNLYSSLDKVGPILQPVATSMAPASVPAIATGMVQVSKAAAPVSSQPPQQGVSESEVSGGGIVIREPVPESESLAYSKVYLRPYHPEWDFPEMVTEIEEEVAPSITLPKWVILAGVGLLIFLLLREG